MRLLRVGREDLELVEFQATVPAYAILSHRWEDEEVLYGDLEKNTYHNKTGLKKLLHALAQAKKDGLLYLWANTCCIDKTNSTELSKAINSMYRWYQNATVCHAYLSDVNATSQDLTNSKWFTRGWTLQELLAPQNVIFFSYGWQSLGTKNELSEILATITGIDQTILQGSSPNEDIAYCLLGIFNVNMPLIYGEGDKAFIRLQEQIASDSDDQTLFAWTEPVTDDTPQGRTFFPVPADQHDVENGPQLNYIAITWKQPAAYGVQGHAILARHPNYFTDSGNYVACYDPESSEPYSISKKRLTIEVRIYEASKHQPSHWQSLPPLAILSCRDLSNKNGDLLAIGLEKEADVRREYFRTHCGYVFQVPCTGRLTTVLIPQTRSIAPTEQIVRPPNYSITLCNIYKGLLTRVKLVDCLRAELTEPGASTRKSIWSSYEARGIMVSTTTTEDESRLSRRQALRGRLRHFIGESIPD